MSAIQTFCGHRYGGWVSGDRRYPTQEAAKAEIVSIERGEFRCSAVKCAELFEMSACRLSKLRVRCG
jgi:hypothetical protein